MQSMDQEVLQGIANWLDEGHHVWLVTVVKTWGSSPRPVGSMLGIRLDGALIGSVSGGCVEEDLLERACGGGLARNLPQVLSYGVTQEDSRRLGLPCGGTLQLVIEPLNHAKSLHPVLEAIAQRQIISRNLNLQNGLVRIQPAHQDQELFFDGNELITVLGPRWRLLIIGAGQVSHYLAEMAIALDYQVTVCDPREEYLPAWNVPDVVILQGMPDDVVREILPDKRTAIICLSHDPKLDDMALLEALISDAFYVGAIGSQRNTEKRRERMAMFDIGDSQIAKLHGPVGIPIGSKTPPEIAVSILAELTAIKRGTLNKNPTEIPQVVVSVA